MSRDNLKEIIERGKQIPAHGSAITTRTKETVEKAKKKIESTGVIKTVIAHRSGQGVRK